MRILLHNIHWSGKGDFSVVDLFTAFRQTDAGHYVVRREISWWSSCFGENTLLTISDSRSFKLCFHAVCQIFFASVSQHSIKVHCWVSILMYLCIILVCRAVPSTYTKSCLSASLIASRVSGVCLSLSAATQPSSKLWVLLPSWISLLSLVYWVL